MGSGGQAFLPSVTACGIRISDCGLRNRSVGGPIADRGPSDGGHCRLTAGRRLLVARLWQRESGGGFWGNPWEDGGRGEPGKGAGRN